MFGKRHFHYQYNLVRMTVLWKVWGENLNLLLRLVSHCLSGHLLSTDYIPWTVLDTELLILRRIWINRQVEHVWMQAGLQDSVCIQGPWNSDNCSMFRAKEDFLWENALKLDSKGPERKAM